MDVVAEFKRRYYEIEIDGSRSYDEGREVTQGSQKPSKQSADGNPNVD
jgi:hypothetical protein